MKDIDLSQDIYSNDEVQKFLRSDRTVKYEYLIRNQYNQTIGSLSNATGSISFDSTREIMRTCNITAKKSELLKLSSVDNRIVPYFCILAPNGHWLKYPLGVFIINPNSVLQNKSTFINVEGYDLAQISNDIKLTNNLTIPEGTVYTSAISQRISSIYTYYDVVVNSSLTRPSTAEYEIGKTELSTINDMLNAINYYPLYFDENGKCYAEPYVFPENRKIQMEYSADNKSIMFDGVAQSSNLFGIPNKFIRYTNDPDAPPLRSEYTVTDANIPSSVTRRGRTITDVEEVKDVSTQEALDSLTRRAAITKSQVTESLTFSTVNMPGHGYKNCIHVRCEDADIDNKYIEYAWSMELVVGGKMTHQCYKAVNA